MATTTKTINKIPESAVKAKGVQALANRPNADGARYGEAGLSAQQLKERFDRLPKCVIDKINEIIGILSGNEFLKYISIAGAPGSSSLKANNLYDFFMAIYSGDFATALQVYKTAPKSDQSTLQAVIFELVKKDSDLSEELSKKFDLTNLLRKVLGVASSKDYIEFDTKNNTVTLPEGFGVIVQEDGVSQASYLGESVTLSLFSYTVTRANPLLYDSATKTYFIKAYWDFESIDFTTTYLVCTIFSNESSSSFISYIPYIDIGIPYKVDGVLYGGKPEEPEKYEYDNAYTGDIIPTSTQNGRTFELSKLGTITYDGTTECAQDFDIVEQSGIRYRVIGKSEDTVRIYQFDDYSNYIEISVEGHHNYLTARMIGILNNTYPTIITDKGTGLIWCVVDLATGDIIEEHFLDFTYKVGNSATPCIDFDNNVVYWFGYATSHNDTSSSNYIKISKYDISNLDWSAPDISQVTLLSETKIDYLGVTQGRKYYDGHIYMGVANTASPFNSKLLKVEADTGVIKSVLEFPNISEIEGVCYTIDKNGKINWYISDYFNTYKLNIEKHPTNVGADTRFTDEQADALIELLDNIYDGSVTVE